MYIPYDLCTIMFQFFSFHPLQIVCVRIQVLSYKNLLCLRTENLNQSIDIMCAHRHTDRDGQCQVITHDQVRHQTL